MVPTVLVTPSASQVLNRPTGPLPWILLWTSLLCTSRGRWAWACVLSMLMLVSPLSRNRHPRPPRDRQTDGRVELHRPGVSLNPDRGRLGRPNSGSNGLCRMLSAPATLLRPFLRGPLRLGE